MNYQLVVPAQIFGDQSESSSFVQLVPLNVKCSRQRPGLYLMVVKGNIRCASAVSSISCECLWTDAPTSELFLGSLLVRGPGTSCKLSPSLRN